MYACMYIVSINIMGPHSHHAAQKGDPFCLLEMNVHKKCKGTTAKDLVKMLEESHRQLSISTVK